MFERPSGLVWSVFLTFAFSSVAAAQVKPRFVIAFDTSGSMGWDLSGNATYGDGVGRVATGGDPAALVSEGIFYGCGTTAGLDRNCDGLPNDSRISIAKQAVRNMVSGFGDVEWALARFHQAQGSAILCSNYDGTNSCQAQVYGNPQCNTGTVDNVGCVTGIPDSCEPGLGANAGLRLRTGADFNGCFNYNGSSGCTNACTDSAACATGDMLVGFPGLGAFTTIDNRPAILKWMDNVETSFVNNTTSAHFCNHAGAGNCELRPTGWTPLGGILDTALTYLTPVRSGDPQSSCRRYSVILITDGAETCGSNPTGRAAALLGQSVRTYVVGVSITSTDQASLNSIASSGGTTSAYFANSPAELAAALSQIVNDSLVFETCNGLDDDCDGDIDEDLPAAQPGSAPQPQALFCDGEGRRSAAQNTQVIARPEPMYAPGLAATTPIKSTVSPNYSPDHVVCGRVADTCSRPGSDDDCDGALDEDGALTACGTCPGAVDVCDGIDNDCDGRFDEGTGGAPFSACPIVCTEDVPCGSNVGECVPGVYRCIAGQLDSTCFGETVPGTEVCDGLDNDCDGIIDDPAVLARPCTTPYGDTGICQPGTQFCARTDLGEIAGPMGYRVNAMGAPVCVGQVLPEDREICDALDHDCDGDNFTCTDDGCSIGPEPAFVGNTCGLGVGVCTGTLVCDENGNPDGGPPALVCNAPSPTPERCNNLDDDCDGRVDEAAIAGNDLGGNAGGATGAFCGSVATDNGVCNRGRFECVNGFWNCAGAIGPSTEICDGLDNDCDNLIDSADPNQNDPRIGQQCGTTIGECEPGVSVCTGGAIVCTPIQGPVPEDCDGRDNDCDNLIDERLPDTMPPIGTRDIVLCGDGTGLCEQGELACVAVPTSVDPDGFDYGCVGGVGPVAELCDGDDNDCDGESDECTGAPSSQPFMDCENDPLGTMGPAPADRGLGAEGGDACGADNPACARGKLKCVADVDASNGDPNEPGLVCVGANFGMPELCNGMDDDCDVRVDETPLSDPEIGQSCGDVGTCRADVPPQEVPNLPGDDTLPCGPCRFGLNDCVAGAIVCIGQVGPDDYESCNLTDDDCDGDVDECVDPTANDPGCAGEVDPQTPIGEECATGAACESGVTRCQDGVLECEGVDQGLPEVCNGLDDDCDGSTDEGFHVGESCGESEGECDPGHIICATDGSGGAVCTGEVGPTEEICDTLDNDCDMNVDEGLNVGMECGTDEGLCETGILRCVNGRPVCTGEVGPQPETCDCEDNDCDGEIDEGTGDNPVCPGESACLMCQCALPCADGVEFGAQCPQGKAAIENDDGCYCVGQLCDSADCRGETIEVDGDVLCAPNNDLVSACVCKNNECTFRCSGVVCNDGLICDPTDGRCKQQSCLLPQFRCPAEQRCMIVEGESQCVDDACAEKECATDEACRDGICVQSCANQQCSAGNRCLDGNCVPDRCHMVQCEPGEVCDPSDGSCTAAGACVGTGCSDGEVCDPVGGECSEDPCLRTRCPYGQTCNSETSQCELRCGGALLYCGEDDCINPMTSREHCGARGDCMGDDAGEACSNGLVCSRGECSDSCADNLINCDGECVDPQNDIAHCGASGSCRGDNAGELCRTGFTCREGVCHSITGGGGSGGPDDNPVEDGKRVIASGGGGCTCSTVGAEPPANAPPRRGLLVLLLAGIALLLLARRRVARAALPLGAGAATLLALSALASVTLGTGCKIDTFCLDCPTPDDDPGTVQDGGAGGSTGEGDGSTVPTDTGVATDATVPDAGDSGPPRPDGGCIDRELCNGLDDDCDGRLDEDADPVELNIDVQTDVRHCGACGNACALAHAFNECVAGVCEIDTDQGVEGCDVGFVDHDGDDANGCEYRCTKTADDDSICDQADNDCDHNTDEDVQFETDPLNCGSCNVRCHLRHVAEGGECVAQACVIGGMACDDGFADLDDNDANGCEHQCYHFPPSPEQCNGVDDDCDDEIDEDVETDDDDIGDACGIDTGECVAGEIECQAGVEVCAGSAGPSPEVCDQRDNDCDGITDTDHPQLGLPCGEATPGSECSKGTLQIPPGGCGNGVVTALVCTGGQGPVDELCNGLDDDCDGQADEEDNGLKPEEGQLCVSTMGGGVTVVTQDPPGECQAGTTECVSGNLICRNERAAEPYDLCDGLDRDCDGMPFTGYTFSGNIATSGPDPRLGDACGVDTGECAFGMLRCHNNLNPPLTCDNQTLPGTETCDGQDDDCDGRIDERPPAGVLAGENVACTTNPDGSVNTSPPVSASAGECATGTTVCAAGRIGCQGQVGPQPELCDALNSDCDVMENPINGVAVSDPAVGDPCGPPTVGVCRRGTTTCQAGANPTVVCTGALPNANYVPPAQTNTPETACDGLDNDCDGATDEGSPAAYSGTPCCDLVGFDCCDMGTRQCSNGRLTCVYPVGARFPQNEACGNGPGGIGSDDDCDGTTDEGFNTTNDPNNCGGCGITCTPTVPNPHAVIVCENSHCAVGACTTGFVDADFDNNTSSNADWQNGCEIACMFEGNEICDNRDNDCNGTIDDLDTIPSAVCIPRRRGVCNVPELLTDGPACLSGALTCDIGALVAAGDIQNYQATESICDSLDNDCDGLIDEMLPFVGQPCFRGTGACQTTGVYVCNAGAPGGYSCNAPNPPAGTAEVCDGLDNNCNGTVDDFGVPSAGTPIGNFELVNLGASTNNTLVMAYEASRPNATSTNPGSLTNKPCSVEGVQPWTNVTWDEARNTCCALNANGMCTGNGQGWRLCDASTYEYVCRGPAQDCTWGYSDTGAAVCDHAFNVATFENVCHGAESTDDNVVTCPDPGDSECAAVTGSTAFPQCFANWSGGPVSDLSGNVQEWTNTSEVTTTCAVSCMTYPAPTPLPARGAENVSPSVTDTISIGTSGTITEVRLLDFSGDHDRSQDLDMYLTSPQGTQITLFNDRCSGLAGWAMDMRDGATANSDAGFCTSPLGGSINNAWAPTQPFSNFVGQNQSGTWTLTIDEDSGTGNEGPLLQGWSLYVCANVCSQTPSLRKIRGGSYNDVEPGRACEFDFEVAAPTFRFPTTGFRCCWYPASGAP